MTATFPPAPPRPSERPARSADGQVVGALLLVAGVGWLLARAGVIELSSETLLSSLLVVLGVGLVLTSRRRGGGGLVLLGIVLTAALAATSSIASSSDLLSDGFGSRDEKPTTIAEAQAEDSYGVGGFHVDLRHVPFEEGDATVLEYRLGVGHMKLVVPRGVAVQVRGEVSAGEIQIFGKHTSGSHMRPAYEDRDFETAAKKLVLDVDLGFGVVEVVRAPD